jgi:hypothetical protein
MASPWEDKVLLRRMRRKSFADTAYNAGYDLRIPGQPVVRPIIHMLPQSVMQGQ